jgi:hypothetical protein
VGSLPDDSLISHPTEGSADMPFDALRGKVRMASDFDRTPDEIVDAMECGSI